MGSCPAKKLVIPVGAWGGGRRVHPAPVGGGTSREPLTESREHLGELGWRAARFLQQVQALETRSCPRLATVRDPLTAAVTSNQTAPLLDLGTFPPLLDHWPRPQLMSHLGAPGRASQSGLLGLFTSESFSRPHCVVHLLRRSYHLFIFICITRTRRGRLRGAAHRSGRV